MDIETLRSMTSEAVIALDEYEASGNSNGVFNKIRAAGDICIDNNDLHPFLKQILDIKNQYDFKSAVFLMRNLSNLTGGRGKNPGLRGHLNYIISNYNEILDRENNNTGPEEIIPDTDGSKDNNKVFIVHGHDDHAKIETARFIENAGLEAIILHEKASGSKTIIEKIESFGDVGFAVILYTPCDVGTKNTDSPILNKRARQNVVFEHGYFIGRLGRSKVAALVKGKIETPNDISGVVYTEIDPNGAWKMTLLKELKEAGYKVDANALI